MKSFLDLNGVIQNASKILPHRCNERCLIAVGPNEYRCRKLNFLLTNRPPNNTKSVMKELPNDLSIDCLRKLERAEIVEPLDINAETGYMKPFKSNLQFFHPKRHIPPVLWTHDMNISPVEGYTFTACQSMQNIQLLTQTGGCNKYVVKYLGKIDDQNYVIVYTDTHTNGILVTKRTFLHNTKVSTSKYNEMKMHDAKREREWPFPGASNKFNGDGALNVAL